MTHSSNSSTLSFALAVRIFRALGAGSGAALALSLAACGGNVVVDSASTGTGGGGGGGGAGSTTNTTGTGTPATCGDPLPEGTELRYLCLAGSIGESCPTLAEATPKLMEQVVGTDECAGTGSCCGPTGAGCVAPPSGGNSCCYYVGITFEICEGRPFVAGGEVLTASAIRRADWQDELSRLPSLAGLDAETRAALTEFFTRSGLFEHASVASFARFSLELLSVGAPASLVLAAQEAMADEVRHAKMCFGLASAYAGEPVGPSALVMENVPLRRTLVEMATSTALEGCINETLSALVAAEEAARATDPAVKAALASIAEDEARHAELAWRTIAWAMSEGGDEVARALAETFAGARAMEPEVVETNGADREKLATHGWIPADEKRAIMRRAMTEIISPSARALLGSQKKRGEQDATSGVFAAC
jgi:hypothetical protein